MYTNEFDAFKAVKRDPLKLRDVTYQTFAVCAKAVKELPLAFIYIKDKGMRRKIVDTVVFKRGPL